MTPEDFLAKADTATRSAAMLLLAGDPDGARNRAYYAMFDAARATLMASGAPVHTEVARTHSGLISAFGLHLVKTGLVDAGLGGALNRAQNLRFLADYTGDPVAFDAATGLVEEAARFVGELTDRFGPAKSET